MYKKPSQTPAKRLRNHFQAIDLEQDFKKVFPDHLMYTSYCSKENYTTATIEKTEFRCCSGYMSRVYSKNKPKNNKKTWRLENTEESDPFYYKTKDKCLLYFYSFIFAKNTKEHDRISKHYEDKIMISIKRDHFDDVLNTTYQLIQKHKGFARSFKFTNNFIKNKVDKRASELKNEINALKSCCCCVSFR